MNRGFTLVELLVALFITAIMFAMGYGAIDQALSSRTAIDEQAARLLAVQRAFRLLEQDLELLQPRPVRNPIGDDYQASLVAGTGNTAGTSADANSLALQAVAVLSLTRAGWSNPAAVSRSELQRVGYVLEEGTLVRFHLPVLDAAGASAVTRRELLEDVEALSFRYMDASHRWLDSWQSNANTVDPRRQVLRTRPVAVEITLKLKDWGSLIRIVEIAG